MKRIISSLFVILLVFSILSCSHKSVVNESVRNSLPISGAVMDKAVSQETKSENYYGTPPSPGGIATIPAEKSKIIIKNAKVQISVDAPEKAMDEISKEVEKQKGYISGSNKTVYINGINATMQIRIPANALTAFLKFLQTLGKEEAESISSEEITKEYKDIESRLVNAIKQMKQLEIIMSKAQKIPELLEVQRQIDSVQERIEQFKGQLSYWDQQVSLSLVDIDIRQTQKAQAIENKPTWNVFSLEQLGKLIKYSWINLAKVIVIILQGILISIPYLLLMLILFLIIKKLIRMNRKVGPKK
jgi:hypothetical protein